MPSIYRLARPIFRCVFFMLLLAGMSACTSQRSSADQQADSTEVPADLYIIFGREGGFAGRMAGYTVRADGTVSQWEGKFVGENVLRTATLPPERLRALWTQVQSTRFFERDQQQVGNMTEFVNITAAGRSHRVSWTVPLGEKRADEPLQQLYTTLESTVHAAMP